MLAEDGAPGTNRKTVIVAVSVHGNQDILNITKLEIVDIAAVCKMAH